MNILECRKGIGERTNMPANLLNFTPLKILQRYFPRS